MTEEQREIPEEFTKIMKDFVSDIATTFPEYQPIIDKWWKPKSFIDQGEREGEDAKTQALLTDAKDKIRSLFNHCIGVYPERFFDILYQKVEIFDNESSVNTEFLPGISFKYLWQCDISEKTKETIWKYLQMVLICIIGSVDNKEAFGDTSKLFEAINEDEFKGKLEKTLEGMQGLFEGFTNGEEGNAAAREGKKNGEGEPSINLPSADDIHGHINSMLGGKLGDLAREIAEETTQNLNIDMEGVTDAKDVFQKLFSNPGKLISMVKNVSDKLDQKMRSGDINKNELMTEASEMLNKMKDMPGMPNIQELLGKMGMGGAGGGMPDMADLAGLAGMAGLGRNAKLDTNAMQQRMDRLTKQQAMKERMRKNIEAKQMAKLAAQATAAASQSQKPAITDEELFAIFSTGETVERTPRGAKPTSDNAGKKKKKKSGK
jgi:hypothetical protein